MPKEGNSQDIVGLSDQKCCMRCQQCKTLSLEPNFICMFPQENKAYYTDLPALPMKSAYILHCLGSSSKRFPNLPPERKSNIYLKI